MPIMMSATWCRPVSSARAWKTIPVMVAEAIEPTRPKVRSSPEAVPAFSAGASLYRAVWLVTLLVPDASPIRAREEGLIDGGRGGTTSSRRLR